MNALDSPDKLKELYLPPVDEFVRVEVPELTFVVIDGEGNPSGESYARAIRWIFAVVHPLKLVAKERMGRNFVEAPLECLWWADDVNDLIAGNRDKLKWRQMIVMPDWITDELWNRAVEEAKGRLGDAPPSLRLESFEEGACVQTMNIGPPRSVAATARRLHAEFLPQNNLVPNGHYHEIYLNDPRRVAPEKLRTVVRQPVRPASCAQAPAR